MRSFMSVRSVRGAAGLAVALTAALSLAACSGSSGSSGGGSAESSNAAPGPSALSSAAGVTEVTFWEASGGTGGVELNKLVSQFNAAHAGKIKVTAVYQGTYPDLLAKYSASVRSGGTPSMVMMYDVGTGFMDDADQTVSAQALAAANPGSLNLADLQPAAKAYYSVGGKLLSAPFNTSTPLLYVNETLLAKAGLSASTPLSSLDEISAAAAKVKSATGVPGFTEPYDGWYVEQLTSSSGSTLCNPGNGRSGTRVSSIDLTAPAQLKALSSVANMYRSGDALDTGTDSNEALSAFDAGKVAMMFNSSGAATQVRLSAGFNWRVLPYPVSGPKATSGPIIGGASLWVNRVGHSPAEEEASWQFISFLDSAASQAAFSQATGYVPINTGSPALASYQATLTKQPELKTALTQLEASPTATATAGCLSGALPTVRNDVISALQSAFGGSQSLASAMTAAQTKADGDISNYLQQVGQ